MTTTKKIIQFWEIEAHRLLLNADVLFEKGDFKGAAKLMKQTRVAELKMEREVVEYFKQNPCEKERKEYEDYCKGNQARTLNMIATAEEMGEKYQ